jgi:hypothetical protein
MLVTQPASMESDDGWILTVGMITSADRWEMVFPIAPDHTVGPFPADMAEHIVGGWIANVMPLLLACVTSDTSVCFVQAEGMVDGKVPSRSDFPTAVEIGTLGTVSLPTSDAALLVYYVDPTKHLSTNRERVAKNFVAGIDKTTALNDLIGGAVEAALETFLNNMANGFGDDRMAGSTTWYRVGKAIRQTAQALPNIVTAEVRRYIGTQRRRMLPR